MRVLYNFRVWIGIALCATLACALLDGIPDPPYVLEQKLVKASVNPLVHLTAPVVFLAIRSAVPEPGSASLAAAVIPNFPAGLFQPDLISAGADSSPPSYRLHPAAVL